MTGNRKVLAYLATALLANLMAATPAHAGADWTEMFEVSGYVESDIRYIVENNRGATPGDGYKFELNRNDVNLRLGITPDERVRAVVDTRLRFYGFNEAAQLPELVSRDRIDPYSLHLDEAYLWVKGLIWDGIDLKFGRMIQNWGTADQFNPTDNLNARDLSDPLDYSAKVPNQMIELDIYPADWLTLSFVWVPVFKPSQLPASATLGFAVEYGKNGCFARAPTPPLRPEDVETLGEQFMLLDPCALNFVDPEVRTVNPPLKIGNSQAAAKAKFLVGDFDFSLSYYYGRFSFPVALDAVAFVDASASQPGEIDVKYIAEIMYPRMHVAGFDFSYSAEWLFDVGFVGEIAVIFPEKVTFGMRAYQGGTELPNLRFSNVNVRDEPFVKATAGFDYTFSSWLYANFMYVRGFFDEFADMYDVHNYVVGAVELKFLEDEMKIRIGTAFNADDISATLNPTVTWVVYPSVELIAGGLIFFGDIDPEDPYDYAKKDKFGMKAAGRSVAFLKGKVSW
ncbi:MAG: hypothetical protein C4523_04495 [Myxococcales bacterium]|nr:MAG: hypothetical protein C4523_04495 [Myxococcales bacterium]